MALWSNLCLLIPEDLGRNQSRCVCKQVLFIEASVSTVECYFHFKKTKIALDDNTINYSLGKAILRVSSQIQAVISVNMLALETSP